MPASLPAGVDRPIRPSGGRSHLCRRREDLVADFGVVVPGRGGGVVVGVAAVEEVVRRVVRGWRGVFHRPIKLPYTIPTTLQHALV